MYVCPNCGNTFDQLPKLALRCPYCGYRMIYKARPPVAKKVKAR